MVNQVAIAPCTDPIQECFRTFVAKQPIYRRRHPERRFGCSKSISLRDVMRQNQTQRMRIDEPRLDNHPDVYTQIASLYELFGALTDVLENLSHLRRPPVAAGVDFYQEVRRFERALIEESLKATRGRQVESARLLNLKPTTLNNKIKVYKINWRRATTESSPQLSGVVPLALTTKSVHNSEGGTT